MHLPGDREQRLPSAIGVIRTIVAGGEEYTGNGNTSNQRSLPAGDGGFYNPR